jgi:predicted Zn-dependent protease
MEADQLGMQYAWKSGYDPEGFIRLFDHMSQKEGHASSTSFFATHPAYGDRIQNALKEYKALRAPDNPSRQYITDTSEFREVKERLRKSLEKTEQEIQEETQRPSLSRPEPSPQECDELLKCPTSASAPNAAPEGWIVQGSKTGTPNTDPLGSA